jgi:glycosyltransferase involved in cell wall biosynthesis
MKICMISRPPVKEITKKFYQRRHHILKRFELQGHDIENFVIHPLKIPNLYLAYGLGMAITPFRFRRKKPDLLLADDLESSMVAVLIKLIYNIPFVFDFIDDYTLIASHEGRALRSRTLKHLEKNIPGLADMVIAATPKIREYCFGLGIPEHKIRMIPNGVDTKSFRPGIKNLSLQKKLNPEKNKVVLFIGKINKYYNLDAIIEAIPAVLKEFPDTRFLFVGDGNYLDQLRSQSSRLGIKEAVVFTGFMPAELIPAIINLSTLCVFSLPNDGALVIYEYMGCAKPIILPSGGTKKMSISKTLIPEDCALRVENSPDGFSSGIQYLFKNKRVGEEMGEKSKERATKFHDWSLLASKYERALQDFIGSS